MTANTLRLVGLGELEQDDVLYWLKATLARDLAAMRAPKSEEERGELLDYAFRRLQEAMKKTARAISLARPDRHIPWYGVCLVEDHGEDVDRFYDDDGDPPWKPMPRWAAS